MPLLLLALGVVSGGCTVHVTTGPSSVARVQSERDRVAGPRWAPRPPRERQGPRPAAPAEPDPVPPEIAEATPRSALPRVPPRGDLRVADFATSPHTRDTASAGPSTGDRGRLLDEPSASRGRPKLAAPERERDGAAESAVDPLTQAGLPTDDKRLRRVNER